MFPTIKQRLAQGEVVMICSVGRVLHHNFLQILGIQGGFHGVWFDLEHIGNTIESLEIASMACRSQGLDSFVRLAPTDYAAITRALECGASGVMAAQVRTADEARQIVRWAKFHPLGLRGLNTGGWDAQFTKIPAKQFCEQANRDTFVAIQIETAEAVEEAAEIASIPEVDLLFVGPADLSQNLGVPGDFWNPRCLEAVERVAAACKQHGKPWGVVPADPKYAEWCVERGCRMLSPASDVKVVVAGVQGVKQAYSTFFK
jgi:2-dehydro-3-deoxyglucarate aldolase/4-hydroxy-2-oxoheptanedioate aldolase